TEITCLQVIRGRRDVCRKTSAHRDPGFGPAQCRLDDYRWRSATLPGRRSELARGLAPEPSIALLCTLRKGYMGRWAGRYVVPLGRWRLNLGAGAGFHKRPATYFRCNSHSAARQSSAWK